MCILNPVFLTFMTITISAIHLLWLAICSPTELGYLSHFWSTVQQSGAHKLCWALRDIHYNKDLLFYSWLTPEFLLHYLQTYSL